MGVTCVKSEGWGYGRPTSGSTGIILKYASAE
jgi:hypothetical protein